MMTMMGVVGLGGVLILAAATLAAVVFRRASASLRHRIWLAAVCAALALPFLEISGWQLGLRVPGVVHDALTELAGSAPVAGSRTVVGLRTAVGGRTGGSATLAGSSASVRQAPISVAPMPPSGHQVVSRAAFDADAVSPSAVPSGRVTATTSGRAGGVGALEAIGSPLPAIGPLDVAMGVWAGGALLLLLGALLAQARAWLLTSRDVRPASPSTRRRLDALAERMGIGRPVRLVVSPRIGVPATWGTWRPTIVLPHKHEAWSPETLDRVLLHELAHVRRCDCMAYLVAELARAIHWPNPLAWLAAHRLRVESEQASDDRVLDDLRAPSAYAQDLVSMMRAARSGGTLPPRSALAMARPSGMGARVRAVLDPRRSRVPVDRPRTAIIGLAALALALGATVVTPLADAQEGPTGVEVAPHAHRPPTSSEPPTPAEPPALAEPPAHSADLEGATIPVSTQEARCVFREGERRSMSTHVDDDEIRIRWETADCRVEIDMEGEVTFAADDSGIVGLGPDALFEIEERLGRTTRRARIEGRSGGGMDRRYWEDGDQTPWGEAADAWLAGLLPEIFRHSTINAEARVRRMLEEGGPDRVFAEVARIQSDHVSRRYLELLMDMGDLDEAGYERVIEAASDIESDHASAELLLAVVARAGLQPAFQDPLLEASRRIESDHQKTRVLQELLRSPLSPDQLDAVLASAASIDSDHNLSELLSVIAREGRLDDAARASFLSALESVDSDHSQATVMEAFLDAGPLSDEELAHVLRMTDGIESDHQRAGILQRVAREYPLTGTQVTAYLRSAARIDSDHQKAETARAVIERSDFDGQQVRLVLAMAGDIDSDHQRAEVLRVLVERRTLTAGERSELLATAGGIDSDHQLADVLSTLIRAQELGPDGVEEILETIRGIDSSHQRADVLMALADRVEIRGDARTLFLELTDDLSRGDRERLREALAR